MPARAHAPPPPPLPRLLLLLPLLLLPLSPRGAAGARGYLVAAPSVFRAGVEEAVSVTLFDPVGETPVRGRLAVGGRTVAQAQGQVWGKGTLKLKAPPGLRGPASLEVWAAGGGYAFRNVSGVTLEPRGALLVIRTDKPVYRPGQRVMIHLYTVGPDLRPVEEEVEAYVVDPRGSRVMEWPRPRPVCGGVRELSFPLADQPVLGQWRVVAGLPGHMGSESFEVRACVLPKFELRIQPPRFIRDIRTCEKGTVSAWYTFGQPVVGTLEVNMTVLGLGYYRHERGPPVVKTTQIEGTAEFEVCAQEMLPAAAGKHFRGAVSIQARVTTADGGSQVALEDSTHVQSALVEAKFGKGSRRRFKAGLPYRGKVEVTYPDGSPADGVTVRIRAELSPKENLYLTQRVSRAGLVEFQVPSAPLTAPYFWLETQVVALDWKPAGDQYLPSYLPVTRWSSPSGCHIQLQEPGGPLQVGEEARLLLWSTCACNFSLHFEVVSRGNIVLSGSQPDHVPRPPGRMGAAGGPTGPTRAPGPEPHICTTSIRFLVTPNMAPTSRLLAYYVRENGEGVTDTLQFGVRASFENQVSVAFSANETRPGGQVDLRIRAGRGSCICLAAVDKSVFLLKEGFPLTPEKIFQGLADFNVWDTSVPSKEDGWAGVSSHRRRRSSIFPWSWDVSKDAHSAFTDAGLVVMSDVVRLAPQQGGSLYHFQPHTATPGAPGQGGPPPRPEVEKKKRTFFPETWLWQCLNVSSSGEARLRLDVPDAIMTWTMGAVGLSQDLGLGLAPPAELRASKPFFVDFSLPGRVVRGEQSRLPLMIHNYMATCVEVHVKISVPKGVKLVGLPGQRHLTRKKCVAPGKAQPTSVVLSFHELGQSNITAKALAFPGNGCCQEAPHPPSGARPPEDPQPDRRAPLGVDHVRRSVLVEPEGLPREYTYSVFLCPNEQIHISTPDKYEYQYVQKPPHMTRFEVAIRAHHSAHIVLSSAPRDVAEAPEIVIGGLQNTRTWISAGRMGDPVASEKTLGVLSWHEFRSFWISWADGVIQVGHGPPAPGEAAIVRWAAPHGWQDPQYVGFSTGWGSAGEFKFWQKEEAEETHNEAFTLGVPHNVVPGSARATASVIGDVMGPALGRLDPLLRLPHGCGEQNMALFAPNIFILKYLQKTHQLGPDVERGITDLLARGYQRQLTYRRSDGSYSAFGERDPSGSMWLTAFVMKSFGQARGFVYIDPKELQGAKDWIVRRQQDDGAFPALGSILNKEIQGGVHGKISLTAYVVTALLEAGVNEEEEKASVAKARHFLESNAHASGDPYTIVLSAYALALLQSPAAGPALQRMNSAAITQGGLTHWSLGRSPPAAPDAFLAFDDGPPQPAPAAEVETAAYGLLALARRGDVAGALRVVRWLSRQRGARGGFASTQDTCVALQALAEYAALAHGGRVNLSVSLASTNLDYQGAFEIRGGNRRLLQAAVIPSVPTGLFVSARGEGCCLLQIDVSYHVPEPQARPAFQILVGLPRRAARAQKHASPGDPPAEQQDQVTLETCVRWLRPGSSNMAVLEVPLLSGFQADVGSLEQLLLNPQIALKRYELSGRKVLFYFDEIPSRCLTCVAFGATRRHLVARTAPLPVRVYDYYEPTLEAARFYNLSWGGELCEGPACNEVGGAGRPWDGLPPIIPCNSLSDGPECPDRNDTQAPPGPCATGGGPSDPPEASEDYEYGGDPAAPQGDPPEAAEE